jgi:hypothetical protein
MTIEPPEWVVSTPATPEIHQEPSSPYQWQQLSQGELAELRTNLIESIVSAVVEAISGFLPFARPALEMLGSIFGDLFGLLGNPSGLGTGDPSLPSDAAQIPLLGPVLGLLENIPIVGDLINLLVGFLSGGSLTEGGLGDLEDLLSNIPLVGDLINMFLGTFGGGGDGGNGSDDPLGFLGGIINDILSMLGLGAIGGGGGVPGDGDTGGTGGQPGSGSFDLFGALFGLVSGLLGAVGGITSGTSILGGQLGTLTPATDNNVQPQFPVVQQALHGQGHWIWDWPANDNSVWGTSPGCVRTRRPGTITIFWVNGTWEPVAGTTGIHLDMPGGAVGMGDPKTMLQRQWADQYVLEADWDAGVAASAATVPMTFGANLLDWSKFDVVSVPYAGALYPLGYSVDQGVKNLIQLIKTIPGKFILMGGSMGGAVISRVYRDEIVNPTGSLHNRDSDLLMGWVAGNPMRKAGTSFPGSPFTAPPGHGVLKDNLTAVDSRWWEWSLAAGTYPAFDQMDGITWPHDDPISDLGDDALAVRVRNLADESASLHTLSANAQSDFMLMMIGKSIFDGEAANVLLGIGFVETQSPHGLGTNTVQPFLASGDHRTFWHYTVDYINDTFSSLASPPTAGVAHEMEGVKVDVKGLQVLHASVETEWINVICSGPAIILGVNCYDAAGAWIPGVNGSSPTVISTDAAIIDPTSEATWQTLSSTFVVPSNAKKACICLRVEPAAMTTGTVWFRNPFLEVTDLIDAGLLTQMQNFPGITAAQVGGAQGEADMLTTLQNLIDKLASANHGTPLTDVQLAQLFASQGVTAVNAASAFELAVAHEQALAASHEPVYVGLSPTGEVTFPLDSFPEGSTLPTTAVTSGNTFGGFITTKKAVTKEFVEFIAKRSGSGAVYINVYDVNTSTGNWGAKLFGSADISSLIPNGADPGWVEADVGVSFAVTANELLGVELVVAGSATTVTIASKTSPVPPKTAVPAGFGATRVTASTGGTSPASLTAGQFTYSQTMPYFCVGVDNEPPLFHPAEQESFLDDTTEYLIPDWAQVNGTLFDLVAVGGGGDSGGAFLWQPGVGGLQGSWQASTKVYGTDIPGGTQKLIVAPGVHSEPTRIGYGQLVPFDAVGGGVADLNTTHSWTHTATAGAYVVVCAAYNAGFGAGVTSVTYGGVTMTAISTERNVDLFGQSRMRLYGLASVAGGAKTVTVTTDASINVCANSTSYLNTTAVGAAQYDLDTSANFAETLVHAFGVNGAIIATHDGGTTRYNDHSTDTFGGIAVSLSIADHIGPATWASPPVVAPGFTAYASIAVPLIPTAATVLMTANPGTDAGSSDGTGHGAGTTNYNGRNYFGGSDVGLGSVGAAPGGGAGGAPGWYDQGAVKGGRGGAWITARQP